MNAERKKVLTQIGLIGITFMVGVFATVLYHRFTMEDVDKPGKVVMDKPVAQPQVVESVIAEVKSKEAPKVKPPIVRSIKQDNNTWTVRVKGQPDGAIVRVHIAYCYYDAPIINGTAKVLVDWHPPADQAGVALVSSTGTYLASTLVKI